MGWVMKELMFERVELTDIPEDNEIPIDFRTALYLMITAQDMLSELNEDSEKCFGEEEFNKILDYVVKYIPQGERNSVYFEIYREPLKLYCKDYVIIIYYLNDYFGIGIYSKEG